MIPCFKWLLRLTHYLPWSSQLRGCLSSVQLLSCVWLFVTPWTAAHQASLSITNSWSLLKLMSIESVMPTKHLILCHPLLLLPSIFPSIRVFSSESVLFIRWTKYWSFSFSISPSNEYSGLISFRTDWLDLLAVQGTLMSLLQYHSSKASILQCSAFLILQLLHPYMTTGKTIALARQTFVNKVMSLLFNMLSKEQVSFNLMAAVTICSDFGAQENKVCHYFLCFPTYLPTEMYSHFIDEERRFREESDTTERLHFHFSLSHIGEGNGKPLRCSCLENSRDGGAWWAAVYGVAQSQTRLKWLSTYLLIGAAGI